MPTLAHACAAHSAGLPPNPCWQKHVRLHSWLPQSFSSLLCASLSPVPPFPSTGGRGFIMYYFNMGINNVHARVHDVIMSTSCHCTQLHNSRERGGGEARDACACAGASGRRRGARTSTKIDILLHYPDSRTLRSNKQRHPRAPSPAASPVAQQSLRLAQHLPAGSSQACFAEQCGRQGQMGDKQDAPSLLQCLQASPAVRVRVSGCAARRFSIKNSDVLATARPWHRMPT